MIKSSIFYKTLEKLYPDAKTMLNYNNQYECLIAVVLSAQTTDKMVNVVTKTLFLHYPNFDKLKNANLEDVENIIKPVGLYKNKAKNIIELSRIVSQNFFGNVPNNSKDLLSLPGVGIKVCNVVLANLYNQNVLAIDTHISRVFKRLELVLKDDTICKMIEKMQFYFKDYNLKKLHHMVIYFGRQICLSRNPKCQLCPFKQDCPSKVL